MLVSESISLTAVTWNESTQAAASVVKVGPAVVKVSKSNLQRAMISFLLSKSEVKEE